MPWSESFFGSFSRASFAMIWCFDISSYHHHARIAFTSIHAFFELTHFSSGCHIFLYTHAERLCEVIFFGISCWEKSISKMDFRYSRILGIRRSSTLSEVSQFHAAWFVSSQSSIIFWMNWVLASFSSHIRMICPCELSKRDGSHEISRMSSLFWSISLRHIHSIWSASIWLSPRPFRRSTWSISSSFSFFISLPHKVLWLWIFLLRSYQELG